MVGIQCIVQSERRGDKRPTAKPKPFSSVMLKGCINSHKHSNCQDCPKKSVLDLPATLGEPWLLRGARVFIESIVLNFCGC